MELERGQRILQQAAAASAIGGLLGRRDGADFVEALGHLFLASQLLEAAMQAHIDSVARPQAFSNSIRRCSAAWNECPDGERALLWTILDKRTTAGKEANQAHQQRFCDFVLQSIGLCEVLQ